LSEPTPQFHGLNLVANDFDATLAFYRLLGVAITDDQVWRTATGPHHTTGVQIGNRVEVDIDSSALAHVYHAGYRESSASPGAPTTVFGFQLPTRDAVDALHDKLVAAGHRSRQAPYDAFWGARYAIVADPDGRDIGFMSPSDPTRRGNDPDL
jgi:uncharacterized glyoxalase superfamily protein PhnB